LLPSISFLHNAPTQRQVCQSVTWSQELLIVFCETIANPSFLGTGVAEENKNAAPCLLASGFGTEFLNPVQSIVSIM
jgi:hypothetical protein